MYIYKPNARVIIGYLEEFCSIFRPCANTANAQAGLPKTYVKALNGKEWSVTYLTQ